MKLSDAGLKLIDQSEGWRAKAYQDSAGVWTVGSGHTGPDVHEGLEITPEQAGILLLDDIEKAEKVVNAMVKVPLTQGQFDALVDFTFNVGAGNFQRSTLLRKLNRGDYAGAAGQFGLWIFAGGKSLDGLVKRRAAEKEMFLS